MFMRYTLLCAATWLVCLLASTPATQAQRLSDDIRLNQIGFYPNAVKLAVVSVPSADSFYVVTPSFADTVFTGTLSEERNAPLSNETTRIAYFSKVRTEGTFVLWIPGPRPDIDTARLERDFAAIVEHQKAIFGDLPYDRYVFLIHCYPGGRGGTEHLNSTIMQVSPSAFASTSSGVMGFSAVPRTFTTCSRSVRPSFVVT
jgi:hypothetical protein